MAYYAAQSYNAILIVVSTTPYTPPIISNDIDYVKTLSKVGDYAFAYAPSYYQSVIATVLLDAYTPPIATGSLKTLVKEKADTPTTEYIAASGVDTSLFGNNTVFKQQFINVGNDKPSSNAQINLSSDYIVDNYKSNITILRSYGDMLGIGISVVRDKTSYATNIPFVSSIVSRQASIRLSREFVSPKGFVASSYGYNDVVNFSKEIGGKGFVATRFGGSEIYNLLQFVKATQYDASKYGEPYMIGGVRFIYPYGYDQSLIGEVVALNTTENRTLKPKGIDWLDIPPPNVSPRIIYPASLRSQSFGQLDIRIPVLDPTGLLETRYGLTTIWFHTRPLLPASLLSYDSGYPKIYDRAQWLRPLSFDKAAVFGDISAKNKSARVDAFSIFDEVVTPWSLIENTKRYYKPKGIDSQSIGISTIYNKTPSIFVKDIVAPQFNTPAIAYRIRSIRVSGFDRLLFGKPLLTKTPEILPKSINSPSITAPTVWYKNRPVDAIGRGINSFTAGEAIAWFRYRLATPMSWSSSKVGSPTATHGVREVIATGYLRDSYGWAWVSQGTRYLGAESIYQDFASRHLVGGAQKILVDGYVATLFGTRIIPESRSVAPLGFAGKYGLAKAHLYTRYLGPIGYISVGTQPADRWGATRAFNLLQFVTQNYDSGNGLVPPAWSDWTEIRNRNKTAGISGFQSQRFGYSKIDNNAAPLLVVGIEPPAGTRFDVSMISYANRPMVTEGIVPPHMSSWAVIHNAARVITPIGVTHTSIGNAEAVKTRRYYSSVGRIFSQEFSDPMIAYRIRTLDIEKRYSIAPPIIPMPAFDLRTKYITFHGFETAKYGLASLSIRFNIIKTRWSHRDTLGEPALKNLTPELGAYGHDSQLFGRASLRTQWRDVYAQGDNSNLFGRLYIADSNREMFVRGWLDTGVSQRHKVTKTGTNPYVLQHIWLSDESGDNNGEGYGIYFNENLLGKRVPSPVINQNVLYAKGFKSSNVGDQRLWSTTISADSGIFIDGVSKDLTVFNKTQQVTIENGRGIDNTIVVGRPRLSPHTIYAVMEAPDQAKENHPVANLHYVGQGSINSESLNKIGKVRLESTIRQLVISGPNFTRFSIPRLENKRSVIEVEGFRSSRFGLPGTPEWVRYVKLRSGIYEQSFGLASLLRPPYTGPLHLKPYGFDATRFGVTYSDNYTRTLYPKGLNLLTMGESKYKDTPYMWQGLRIGEHVPLIIGGDDLSIFGETNISLYVRNLEAVGFNDFSSGYELSSFKDRMTVENGYKDIPISKTINNYGFISSAMGVTANIKLAQHYIRPDGNSDQFRKGGYHA